MARAGAAVVLALAVCCLLVAPAPARRPLDLPPQLLDAVDDREAAAEPLLPKLVEVADAEEANQATAIAVPEEEDEEPRQRSSLLCLVFRCGAETADAGEVAVARGSFQGKQALDGWAQPAAVATAEEEVHGEEQGPYESDSDCDSDSDDENEGGIVGWFWRLAHGF